MSLSADINLAQRGFAQRFVVDEIHQGVTALFGPSGCGKTSVLRAIAGLDRHHDSRVQFSSQWWQRDSAFTPAHLRRVGYVFQEASLFEHLTVVENLSYASKRRQENSSGLESAEIIDLLGIETLLEQPCATLSGGQRQRVAIARTLCARPKLMLMDEPLSALDNDAKRRIFPTLQLVCQQANMPILYVTHSLDEVARLADYLIVMKQGAVTDVGSANELLTNLMSPLSQQANAAAVLSGVVAEHDDAFSLMRISTDAGDILVHQDASLAVGDAIKLKLSANDISIALNAEHASSILNSLPSKITDIHQEGESQVLVKLNANGAPLLARITRKSCHKLGLHIGQTVFVQIKSVAIL